MKKEETSKKYLAKNRKTTDYRAHKIVYQHNKLVEARYNLTLQEKRVLLWCLTAIPSNTVDEIGTILIPVKEFCEIADISIDGAYSKMKKLAILLRSRTLTIENLDNQSFSVVGWVDRIEYHEKEGVLHVDLCRFLTKFLLELKSNFTAIPMSQTLGLSSIYAIRIFELIKQYEKIGEREISLSDLRSFCGISDNKLKDYNDVKSKVLNIAKREIELKTDIIFDFIEIKKSRKVTGIKFLIQTNSNFGKKEIEEKKKLKKALEESKTGIQKQLLELGFSKTTIYKFFNQNEEARISKALSVVLDQVQKGQALNPKALFRTALKEKWSTEVYTSKNKKDDF